MIEVRNLTKYYGRVRAVENIAFSAGDGDILGFLGPNGAGKSTTMRMLTCYTPPTSGEARVAGFDIRSQSLDVRRSIGYMPENTPLYTEMRVRDYVDFMARLKGLPGKTRRAAVDLALEETGLEHVSRRLIGNLSKGYRQRAGLAQALAGDPRVLILDEPTVGLDPAQIREIRSLIHAMRGRRTVLLSTHILPEVSMTCNKVVIINEGRIEASGTPENLLDELQETVETRAIFGDSGGGGATGVAESVEKAIRSVDGVRAVRIAPQTSSDEGKGRFEAVIEVERAREVRPALARAILAAGADLFELRAQGMTLEDIFLRVVSRESHESGHSGRSDQPDKSDQSDKSDKPDLSDQKEARGHDA